VKLFRFFILFYLFLQVARILFIIHDQRVADFMKRYEKKEKTIAERKSLVDKHGLLLQYSVFEQQRFCRKYLFPECIPILGLVGFEGHGMSGLEQSLERALWSHFSLTRLDSLSGKHKADYTTTKSEKDTCAISLNMPLSLTVYQLLKNAVNRHQSQYGCCIVMDGDTGGIDAYVQYPSYDPREDNHDLFFLYPLGITQAYELGSVVKAFLMLAALEEEVVSPDSLINCYGTKEKKFGHRVITTWKAHGVIPFKEVIKGSNNIGVAQVGLKIGKKLYEYYKKCGFGEQTGIEIIGEHKGILHHPDHWSKQSLISLTFGYEMAMTLLQGVAGWSFFLHDGFRVKPTLLIREPQYSERYFSSRAIAASREILELDQKEMRAFGLKKKLSGKIFGKTGTANVIIDNQYDKEKNTYSFLGHYEDEKKKKIIGIFVYGSNDHKLYASNVALPLFLDIVSFF
jgi:cell division protein FtsI/penicillin-binding protein 2